MSFKKPSGKKILSVLRRASSYTMWFLFVAVISWLGYLWYYSVHAYNWTEQQKTEYRSTYAGQTSFREERFNQTVELLKERIQLHQTLPTVTKNIFTGTTLTGGGE